MSLTHDKLAGDLKRQYPNVSELITNQMTIAPAYFYNSYGIVGKPINMMTDSINQLINN